MGYGPALPIDKSGSIVVQSGPMNLYARPGAWTISQLSIQDFAGRLVTYSGNELARIIPNPTFQVVNTGTPDILPPTVSAGKLLTPRVSLSSGTPFFGASFTVADNLSGVSEIFILLAGPRSNLSVLASGFPPSPVLNGDIITGADMSSFKAGVGIWTMTVVQICDAATNCLFAATPDRHQAAAWYDDIHADKMSKLWATRLALGLRGSASSLWPGSPPNRHTAPTAMAAAGVLTARRPGLTWRRSPRRGPWGAALAIGRLEPRHHRAEIAGIAAGRMLFR